MPLILCFSEKNSCGVWGARRPGWSLRPCVLVTWSAGAAGQRDTTLPSRAPLSIVGGVGVLSETASQGTENLD